MSNDDSFYPGEVAIIVGGLDDQGNSYKGAECVILAEPKMYDWLLSRALIKAGLYVVQVQNGEKFQTPAKFLRKKPQPGDRNRIVRWADCPWQPKHLRTL